MSSNIETDVNSRLTTQENANHIHARMFYKDHCYVHIPSAAEVKPKKQNNEAKLAPQPLTISIPEKKRKIRTIKNVKLVPVRLKSGEEVKATQDLIIHFRDRSCKYCSMKFANNTARKKHVQIHKKACKYCNKKFTTEYNAINYNP